MAEKFKQRDPKDIITETVPVFFFLWHVKKRKITYVTPKFYDMVEYPTSLKDKKDFSSFIDEFCHEQFEEFFNSLTPKNNFTNKIELKTRGLKHVNWVEIKTFPVEEPNQKTKLVVGHIVDTTIKKEEIDSLEGLNRNFDTMMQLISHDMRQPFTKISLLADLIMMENSENRQINHYVDKIKDVSSEAHELLLNFLQLTVLDYSEELSTKNEDLGHLIHEAVEPFDEELAQKKLILEIDIPEKKLIYPVDASLFKQLIKNFLSNSIKFTTSGGTIKIKLSRGDDAFKIEVSDTGIGIPPTILSNIFKDVTSVKRIGLEGQRSTGLGLIIVKKITERHNGTIDVKSKENSGTTFTVTLPLQPRGEEHGP